MRVLWFTLTPSLFDTGTHGYEGVGWVESLEQNLRENKNIELAISFFHPTAEGKSYVNDNLYYPILDQKQNRIVDAYNILFNQIYSPKRFIPKFIEVVEDFKPDIIQIFGTEHIFAYLQKYVNIPIVIHIQGIVVAYDYAYYPPGFNKFSFLFNSIFKLYHYRSNPVIQRLGFQRSAKREIIHFENAKYFMGRTNWDKNICKVLAPNSQYFLVNEVLRQPFYQKSMASTNYEIQDKIYITSTISPNVYKGIDLILKTAQLLTKFVNIEFEWNIVGLSSENKIFKFFQKSLKINAFKCNVKCFGVLKADLLAERLLNSHLYIHPSYIDNSPNSICEAQMIGLPVIACNVGGVSSIIDDGINGILVPSNGVFELAYHITERVKNPAKYEKIGKSAHKLARLRHDKETIVKSLVETYTKILSK